MTDRATTVNCPTCGKPVRWQATNRWRPFCSDRCKLVDLSGWVDETHRIPGASELPDDGLDGSEPG